MFIQVCGEIRRISFTVSLHARFTDSIYCLACFVSRHQGGLQLHKAWRLAWTALKEDYVRYIPNILEINNNRHLHMCPSRKTTALGRKCGLPNLVHSQEVLKHFSFDRLNVQCLYQNLWKKGKHNIWQLSSWKSGLPWRKKPITYRTSDDFIRSIPTLQIIVNQPHNNTAGI